MELKRAGLADGHAAHGPWSRTGAAEWARSATASWCGAIGRAAPWGPAKALGLDTGSAGLRLLELVQRRGQPLALGVLEAAPWRSDRSPAEALPLLRQWVRLHGLEGRPVALAVASKAVMLRRVRYPSGLTDDELALEVYAQACSAMPWAADDLLADFSIVGPSEEPSRIEVLTAATRAADVQPWVAMVRQAGLRPRSMEVDAHAAWRAVQHQHRSGLEAVLELTGPDGQDRSHEAVAVAECGPGRVALRVFNALDLHFEREQSAAGARGSRVVGAGRSRASGEDRVKDGVDVEAEDWPADPVEVEAHAASAAAEIVRWLQHCRAGAARLRLVEIWLGGGGWTPSACEALRQATGLPVRPIDPLAGLTAAGGSSGLGRATGGESREPPEDPSAFLVALGLALGAMPS